MKELVLITLFVSCIALAALPGAAAQETAENNTANVTAPSNAPGAELVIDSNVVVTDYWYADGQMHLKLWSDEFKPVSVAPRADSSDSGTITARTHVVDADTETTVSVASPGGVSIWTTESVEENNQFHFVRKPSSFFIRGPWSGADVRNAGFGGALGVAIAVLYTAIRTKIGAGKRGERVA